AISVQEGIDMMAAVRDIRNAPDFSMAFAEKILGNPVLRDLFLMWIQAVRRNQGAAANQPANKGASGEYVYSRIEVETWLDTVTGALEKMKAAQKETPINIAAVGLEVIDRKAELLKLSADPMSLSGMLTQMANVPGLDDVARRYFFNQLT